MTYEEYKKDLTDQIGNKRAKQLVMQEIDNHIEELTDSLEEDGMEHGAALEAAVKEMGNPVETGMELNRIHRPKFPVVMYALAVALTIFGIFLQSRIFPVVENSRLNHQGLSQTIGYNIVALLLTLGIVFVDYTVIVKHAYKLFVGYLIMMIVVPFMPGIPLLHNSITTASVLAALFPILFAAILYRQRGQEWKGTIKSMALLLLTATLIMIFGYTYSLGFMIETVAICFLMLLIAIVKGIMGKQRWKMILITLSVPAAVFVALIGKFIPLAEYQQARIDVIFHPEAYLENADYNYISVQLRRAAGLFTASGNHSFEEPLGYLPSTQMHTDYAVNSMFTWFGMAVGALVLIALFAFCVYSLYMSLKQSNRISFLFGTMCSVTLLLRSLFYVLNNFGMVLNYSTYFPFLKYGLGNALVNGCYIGIIMCVYRNSNILGEKILSEKGKVLGGRQMQ